MAGPRNDGMLMPFCVITRDEVRTCPPVPVVPEIEQILAGDVSAAISDAEFDFIRALARQHSGIVIADFKRNMLLRRISKRLRALELKTVGEYCAHLRSRAGASEIEQLINVLTTNKTEFFREPHHFNHLRTVSLPAIVEAKRAEGSRRIRIWSAGCSTGEEAWSLAMTVHASLGMANTPSGWDVKILASDIDTEVLAKAAAGRYRTIDANTVPPALRQQYLSPADGQDAVEVLPALRRLVTFKPLNLHGPWPFRGTFDIIFCRNVVIYFDRTTQRLLFNRIAGALSDPGYLYCGHSESLHGISTRFEPVGRSVYEKLR